MICKAVCSAFVEMRVDFNGWYDIIFLTLKVKNVKG